MPDRKYCTGLIATINETAAGPVAVLRFGMIEDPVGSHFWSPSERMKAQRARGSLRYDGHGGRASREASRAGGIIASNVPDLPWRRRCPIPTCNVLAEIRADLLASE